MQPTIRLQHIAGACAALPGLVGLTLVKRRQAR